MSISQRWLWRVRSKLRPTNRLKNQYVRFDYDVALGGGVVLGCDGRDRVGAGAELVCGFPLFLSEAL
jgi:hypothetical protein